MIRKANINDVELFYELNVDMENQTFDYRQFQSIYESLLNDPEHIFLVGEVDGKGAAGLHMRMEMQLHHCAKVAEMIELTVLPEYRSMGIGSKLTEAAIELAKKENCSVIELRSNVKRERAHRLYEKLGFVKTHVSMMINLEEN